jgi:hypothetical protein
MVTIYHRSYHTRRLARTQAATPNASSVTLQALFHFAYDYCSPSSARALPVPTPLAVSLWRDLHSVRHPSHLTSTSHPHRHHGTRLDSPSECNLQTQHGPCRAYDSNSAIALLLAVCLAASAITPLLSHQTCLQTCLAYLRCGSAPSPLMRRGNCRLPCLCCAYIG